MPFVRYWSVEGRQCEYQIVHNLFDHSETFSVNVNASPENQNVLSLATISSTFIFGWSNRHRIGMILAYSQIYSIYCLVFSNKYVVVAHAVLQPPSVRLKLVRTFIYLLRGHRIMELKHIPSK